MGSPGRPNDVLDTARATTAIWTVPSGGILPVLNGDEAPQRSARIDSWQMSLLVGWGLTVWAVVALSMGLVGHVLLTPANPALLVTVFVSVVPLMAMVTYPVYWWLNVPLVARPVAAASMSIPGMVLDAGLLAFAQMTSLAMDPPELANFGAVLLFGYAIVLVTGFVPRRS